jgi:peptidoglycan hydrolase CwlO-like protein
MKRFLLILSILLLLFSTGNSFAAEVTHTTTNKIVHQQVQKKSLFGRVKALFTGDEMSDEEKVLLNERKKKKKLILKRRREKAKEAEEAGAAATGETSNSGRKTEENKNELRNAGDEMRPAQTNQPTGSGGSAKGTVQSTEGLK